MTLAAPSGKYLHRKISWTLEEADSVPVLRVHEAPQALPPKAEGLSRSGREPSTYLCYEKLNHVLFRAEPEFRHDPFLDPASLIVWWEADEGQGEKAAGTSDEVPDENASKSKEEEHVTLHLYRAHMAEQSLSEEDPDQQQELQSKAG